MFERIWNQSKDFVLPLLFVAVIVGGIIISFGWFAGDQSLEALLGAVALLLGVIAPMILSASKLDWLSGMSRARIRRSLFYSSVIAGVGVCVIALVVGINANIGLTDFWHSALLNLGTEILGAAFVFLLLEGIWEELSKRASDAEESLSVASEIRALKEQISKLNMLLDERHSTGLQTNLQDTTTEQISDDVHKKLEEEVSPPVSE